MKLVGDCPTTHPSGGQPMRYRFLYRAAGSAVTPTPITGAGLVDAVKVGTRPVPWNFGGGVSTFPQDVYVAGSGGYVGPMPAPFPPPPAGPPPGSWGSMPPLILQPDALGWVTMPPDATNQGFSGPLLRLHSEAIAPGGTPPTVGPGNPDTGASQKSGLDFEISLRRSPPRAPRRPGQRSATASIASTSTTGSRMRNSTSRSSTWTPARRSPPRWIFSIRWITNSSAAGSSVISTSAVIPGGTPTLPGLGVITNPPTQSETVRGGNGSVHLNTGTWPQCAYAVIFSRSLKLTDGEIDDSGRGPMVAIFCKH